jgi:hypothetical protein
MANASPSAAKVAQVADNHGEAGGACGCFGTVLETYDPVWWTGVVFRSFGFRVSGSLSFARRFEVEIGRQRSNQFTVSGTSR